MMRRTLAFAKRNVKEVIREPLSIIFLFALPLVMLVAFYFLFGAMTDQFQMRYLAPGIVSFGGSFLSLFVGMLIASDRGTAFLVRLFTTPLRPYEYIGGYIAATLPLAIVQSALFFAVATIIDTTFFGAGLFLAMLANLLVSLLYIGFGILFGSICNERSIGGCCSILITGQSVLSGMWFPPEGLSEGFVAVMDALPFRNATVFLQSACAGEGEILRPMLVLVAYTVVVTVLATFVFAKKMKQ